MICIEDRCFGASFLVGELVTFVAVIKDTLEGVVLVVAAIPCDSDDPSVFAAFLYGSDDPSFARQSNMLHTFYIRDLNMIITIPATQKCKAIRSTIRGNAMKLFV